MTYRQIRNLGTADGSEDVAVRVREEDGGGLAVASWPRQDWSGVARSAGAARFRGVRSWGESVYYAAYARAAARAVESLPLAGVPLAGG